MGPLELLAVLLSTWAGILVGHSLYHRYTARYDVPTEHRIFGAYPLDRIDLPASMFFLTQGKPLRGNFREAADGKFHLRYRDGAWQTEPQKEG